MSRIVFNHTTFVEGLLPKLRLLANEIGAGIIIPGPISKTRGRSEALSLRVSPHEPQTQGAGYKMVCRRGKAAQDVYIITRLSLREIMAAVERVNEK
jgi:hypothetical protein